MRYGLVVTAVLCALFCRIFLVSVYKVPSHNMAPSIVAGDFLLSSKISFGFQFPWSPSRFWSVSPQRGELVVYISGSKTMIKRVVALPGERILTQDSRLAVNGQPCNSKKIESVGVQKNIQQIESCAGQDDGYAVLMPAENVDLPDSIRSNLPEMTLAPGQYLLANDNRSSTATSPLFEVVDSDQIIGKPMLIWVSYASTQDFISEHEGLRWNRILTKPL